MKTRSQQIADKINKTHGWKEGATNSHVTADHVDRVTSSPLNHPIDVEIMTEHRRLTKRRTKL